jgi:hypothetical protein
MAVAGVLEIQMLANLARLQSDMTKTKGMVGGAMTSVERSVNMAKRALGALGIGISAVVFTRMIKGSIDAQENLRDLSDQTNISIRDLSGLDLAAKQSGGSLSSVADAVSRLSRRIGADAEKYRQLGITAKEPLEAFKQLSDLFLQLDDPMQRSAVMAQALGRSWQGAAPLLAKGSAEIGRMVEKGRELSGITDEGTREASLFNDQMAELGVSFGATRDSLVGKLLPGMNDIVLAMKEAAKEGGVLLTVWVGLGGALANLIGATERHRTAQRLEEINDQLAVARKQLAAGSLRPEGVGSHFFSFLVPDVKLGEQQLARIRQTVTALEQERARLQAASATAGGGAPAAGGDAGAASRAAAFLANSDATDKARLKAAQEAAVEMAKIAMADLEEYENTLRFKSEMDMQAAEEAERLRQEKLELIREHLAEERSLVQAGAQFWIDTERAKIEQQAQMEQQVRDMRMTTWQMGAELLMQFAGKSKTAAIAVIAINKALAIAQTIQSTSVAVMRAFAELGPIAGAPVAASMKALGAIQVGIIAATGLFQAANLGGGGAAAGTPANPISTQPVGNAQATGRTGGQTTIVNLHGQTYTRAQVRELLEIQNENSVDGSRTVVVER